MSAVFFANLLLWNVCSKYGRRFWNYVCCSVSCVTVYKKETQLHLPWIETWTIKLLSRLNFVFYGQTLDLMISKKHQASLWFNIIKNRHLLTLSVKACTKFTNHHKTETIFHKLCLDLGCSFHSLKLTLDNNKKIVKIFQLG